VTERAVIAIAHGAIDPLTEPLRPSNDKLGPVLFVH